MGSVLDREDVAFGLRLGLGVFLFFFLFEGTPVLEVGLKGSRRVLGPVDRGSGQLPFA